jgi:hypothetical protein
MYKERILKLKIRGTSEDLQNYKKNLKKAIDDKILPEMKGFLKEFLLGKGLRPGQHYRWDRFYSQNAGIITKAIMDRADKNKINLLDSGTEISVENLPPGKKGVQVVLNAKVAKEAARLFTEKKFSLEAVIRRIYNFDEATAKEISEDVAKDLKEKGKF